MMISIVALTVSVTIAAASQYSGFPRTDYLVRQVPIEQNSVAPTKQVPGYPISQVLGFPTRQVSYSPAKQVPSFTFEKAFDLLAGQIPGFSTRQSSGFPTVKGSDVPVKQDPDSAYVKGSDLPAEPVPDSPYVKVSGLLDEQDPSYPAGQDSSYPAEQDPSFPAGQDSSYPAEQDPSFPAGQDSSYPAGQDPSFPAGQDPSYPAEQDPSFPAGQDSSYPAGQDPSFPAGQDSSYPAGQDPSFPAGQDPSYPTGQDPSFPAGQYPRHVSRYPGLRPGSPISCYPPPIPGSPINYYERSQLLDDRDQDPSPGSIGRLANVPLYTSLLKDFDQASKEIQKHVTLFTGDALTSLSERNDLIQYITIMFTIDQLIEGLVKRIPYNIEKIIETYKKARTSPMIAAAVVLARLRITSSQLSLIRDFIIQKQQTDCQEPDSYECNVIIDKALASSTDSVLQQQAKLLAALGQEMKLFITDYADEIKEISKNGTARNYVTSASDGLLKPLLEAGVKARKLSLQMPVNWFNVQMELEA